MSAAENIGRRKCIPVLYTIGTHYDIGFDMGRTFASIIQNFLSISTTLNKEYLPAYATSAGKRAYDDTLASVKTDFPQYVRELEGIAEGANVPFYKLFLLHMDNIILNSDDTSKLADKGGCTTVVVNNEQQEILGHTEDALAEVLNHFYFVSAHVISDKPQGRWGVKEERFMSLCYAGHLPGYTMNYNHHGLIFSINTLSAKKLYPGKTPRHFLTRALLSAENFEQAERILRNTGTGAADGCSINMTFLKNDKNRIFYNIEIAPGDKNETQMDILSISRNQHTIHCNAYLHLQVEQVTGPMIDSSIERLSTLKTYTLPSKADDVTAMLSDCRGCKYEVFRDSEDEVKTIAVGIFDCIQRTWSIYADSPKNTEPLVTIPLIIKD